MFLQTASQQLRFLLLFGTVLRGIAPKRWPVSWKEDQKLAVAAQTELFCYYYQSSNFWDTVTALRN